MPRTSPVRTAGIGRQLAVSLRAFLMLSLILGIGYPVAVWAVGQSAFHHNANGQPVEVDGTRVGSAIIGQPFTQDDLFHSRPSAGGYDPLASAPSNLGPSSPHLLAQIDRRTARVAETEGVDPADVPADAVTASGSGLDPYISPAYAAIQVDRVAWENGIGTDEVRRLVEEHTDGRILGYVGEPKVNVLGLNIAVRAAGTD